jgi:hypothetical protein
MLPLLLVLLQAVPAQRTLEERLAAFAKGEDEVRADILKAGPCAIPPLLKLRDQAPERIDRLLYELKKSAAGFPTQPLADRLDQSRSIDSADIEFFSAIGELCTEFPLILDPSLFQTHFGRKLSLVAKERPRREILESLCRQSDLDYGFFFGTVLIAAPVRLWPRALPLRDVPLSAEETERARTLVERLGVERVEDRDAAYAALMKLGKGAILLIEEGAKGSDREGRARCLDLLKRLKAPPLEGTFHVPAVARQKLSGADEELRKALDAQIGFKVQDIALDGAMRLLLQSQRIPFQLAPALKDVRLTLDVSNINSFAAVALATQSCGFDFLILDGKLVIDWRENIARLLETGR